MASKVRRKPFRPESGRIPAGKCQIDRNSPPPPGPIRVAVHDRQQGFLDSRALFRGYVGGRGSGKTVIGAVDMLMRASAVPGTYMLAAPTYDMLRDTSAKTFVQVAERYNRVVHRNQFQVQLVGGSTVLFRTAQEPERMRGPNLSGIWLEEASVMKEEAFDISIACLREGGVMGWLTSTFTPKGKQHWTYKVFGPDPATGLPRPNTELFHSSTADNPFLPPEFEQTIREKYTAIQAKQEMGGAFLDPQGAIFQSAWYANTRYHYRGDYYVLGGRSVHPHSCTRFATVDLACSTKETADYTVIATWDLLPDGHLVLAHVLREKLEAPQIPTKLVELWRRFRWSFAAVEVVASWLAVRQYIEKTALPIRAFTPQKDKKTRSVSAQVRSEQGKVWLPASAAFAPWLSDFEAELFSFTGDEKLDEHDDQVDCFSAASAMADHQLRSARTSLPGAVGGMDNL